MKLIKCLPLFLSYQKFNGALKSLNYVANHATVKS